MRRKKLQPTKIALLEAARSALAEKGHSEFSMRSVAKEGGVHLRTVQYYFPTRRDLLTEVLEYTLSTYYLGQYPVTRNNFSGLSPDKKFDTVIGFLFDDLKEPFVGQFFPEIWALAARDEDASAALDRFYVLHRQSIAAIIAEVKPQLSARSIAQRTAIVAMLIEGLLLLVGHGKPTHSELRGLRSEVIRQCRNIIDLDE
ncbi:MAG: TetR/AcrR family transcriptional regulator [Gammaproteobacteria bacterium]|nr:TetR/AcrR family transcriptional regulator [Gammaproteobacteria bacterium]MDE0283437.1 TetR/AcrR family transcriptional regulator [Gammaproteobacteria bacterium]MDE0511763.1 TetR/AcrR family transcriptional regulator [Gammaproteobacteria bacterium]MYH70021.1 TetR/AcrR family transcriptional regulator [Gammaproteobacteria bacterium]